MRTYEHTLEGVYDYKLDPKCRVSVPSDWRVSAGKGTLRLLRASKFELPTLKVLTEEEFAAMLDQIDTHPTMTFRQKQMMRDRLFSDCQKTKMNPQGKLLVPKALCEINEFEMEGKVSLVGRGTYFELIKPEHYEQMRMREAEEITLLDSDMGIF